MCLSCLLCSMLLLLFKKNKTRDDDRGISVFHEIVADAGNSHVDSAWQIIVLSHFVNIARSCDVGLYLWIRGSTDLACALPRTSRDQPADSALKSQRIALTHGMTDQSADYQTVASGASTHYCLNMKQKMRKTTTVRNTYARKHQRIWNENNITCQNVHTLQYGST